MELLRSEMVKHMLEAADARNQSPLFLQASRWNDFEEWCRNSTDASRLISSSMNGIETFCLDPGAQVYYIAMSIETLDKIVGSLIGAYEDLELGRLFAVRI